MRKYVYLLVLITVILILAVPRLQKQPKQVTLPMNLGNKVTLQVEVADTETEHIQGYSNHPPIGYQEGLLFVFESEGVYPFWMKEMLFDLDLIFINNDRVVYLLEKIKAPVNNQGQIEYANSQVPFSQLLEVRAGFIDRYNIKIGDFVAF
jgi:uncharacterized membrane protein (UPF0127 family)